MVGTQINPLLLALIPVAATLLGGFVAIAGQTFVSNQTRRRQLIDTRREIYAKYMTAAVAFSRSIERWDSSPAQDADADFADALDQEQLARSSVLLVGNDRVLDKADALAEAYRRAVRSIRKRKAREATGKLRSDEVADAYEELIETMRQDIDERSNQVNLKGVYRSSVNLSVSGLPAQQGPDDSQSASEPASSRLLGPRRPRRRSDPA
jgi:hypothetical protein